MTYRKPFDKKLHDRLDTAARQKIKDILATTRLTIKDNENRYGVDLIVSMDNKFVCNFETEVKEVWDGDKFPYSDIQLPARKMKFAKDTYFIMFNKDLSHHLTIKGSDLASCETRSIVNKYSQGNKEDFIIVPTSIVKFDWLYKLAKKKSLNNMQNSI